MTYLYFEFLFSALFQVFELTEDYDKAIIPYQTKEIALNVTAEINLRSSKLHKNRNHIVLFTCLWKRYKLFSLTDTQEHPVCEGS